MRDSLLYLMAASGKSADQAEAMEPPENGASLDDGEVVSDKAWELLNGDSSPKLKPDGEGGANASATKQADTCGGDSVAVNDDAEMSEALAKDQNSVSDVKLIVNGCDSESGTQDKCSTESVEISSAEVDEPSSNKTGSVDPAKEDPGIASSVSDGGDAALKAFVSSEAAETSTVPNGGTCELEDGGAPDLDSNSDKDIVQLPAEETVGASCVDQTSDLLRDSSASSSSAQVDNAGDSSEVGVDADASDVTQSGVEGDSAGRSNEEAGTLEVEQKGEEKNTEAEETTSTGDIVEQNDTSACDKGTSSAPDADNKMETGDVDNSDQPLVVPLPAETNTSDSNSAADNSSAVDRAGESANSSDKPDLSSEKQSASSDSAGPETVPSKPSNALYPLGKPVTDGVGSVNKPAKPAVKVKATARKSGQPVNKTSIIVNDSGGPGSGTIKIVNYGNSNITLKLSELEDVLKVKDVSKSVIKPDASKSLPKSVAGGDVSRNHQDKDKMDAAHAATVATCTADPTSEGAKFGSPKHKIGRMRFRKKRRGGTYDFPGMKKIPKKKKPFSLPGGNDSLDSKSEDGASDFEPLRKVSHKTIGSPRKCNALDLLTKNSHRAFRKRRNAMLRRKSDSPLKGRSVMDMLRERLAAGGDRTNSGDGVASSQTTPARSSQFVTKDITMTDGGEDCENIISAQRKRKVSDDGTPIPEGARTDDPSVKKRKTGESDDKSKPPVLQPMVMVVANHLPNPGLRSILPKPNVTAAQVVVSGGQPLLVPAQPLLIQPGTKVSLVPTSVGVATPGVSFITGPLAPPKTSAQGAGGKGAPVTAVIDFRPTVSSQLNTGNNSDALRALLSKSGTVTGLKSVPVISGLIPAQVVPISSTSVRPPGVATNTSTIMSVSQGRVLFTSSSSMAASLSTTSVLASKLMATAEAKVTASLPNGLSMPVTPPKTPEGEATADGTSSGTVPDKEVIPLCCCKIGGANFTKLSSGATYCQALDSVDGKALGCCNKVTNTQLVRPGVKIPFMLVCEVHRKRLKLHQCCPGCGHFCTEGKFLQCQREGGNSVHNFHKQCQTVRGGKLYCPHCGEESAQVEVTLTLHEARPKETNDQIRANLRSKIAKARMTLGSLLKKKPEASPVVSITLPSSKTISSDGLPVGPEREHLERLMSLCNAKAERPKKYRVLPKNMYPPAAEGDVDKVFYMLMDGMDPNQRCEEEDEQTPLHGAAYSGIFGMVYLLVQAGAVVHTPDKTLKTPLMCASEYGHLAIMKYLVAAGARLDDRGEDRMTCLHYAAKAGHMDVIQYILDIDALDVNVTDEGGWTPIMWATESQLVDVVQYLVSRGGDPNKKDNEENNGLHWAAFAGSIEITELFLDMGCEIDTPNEHGDRPLHIAARQNHYEVVVLLLARGANVDVRNNKDETPVACCGDSNSQVSMALKVNKQLRSFAAKLARPERLLHRDVSVGRERNPIACVNDTDDEPYPTDYLYVDHNVETQDLHINNVITSLQSCRCKDDCSSLYCVCARSSVRCWYDKFGRLLEDFNLLDPPHIFECNRACRCWINCNNRVVQNGITCRLQMFRTNGRGWGVRSLMDIPKGTFICEYIGELISDSEADRREDDSYLFDLDNKDGDTYCIDARKYGNVARFINHLCEPNIVPVKVFVEHQDLRFPRICFFSSREIKAYEELGFDYGEKFWIIKWKQFTCACGSPKCKYSTETIKRTLEEYRLRHEEEDITQDT